MTETLARPVTGVELFSLAGRVAVVPGGVLNTVVALRRLGVNLTSDPNFSSKNLFIA